MPDRNVIIAGGGRVGFQTAEILADRGDDITIIERDGEVVERIARPETRRRLTPGNRYVVAVEPDVDDEVMNLLRG